MTTIRSMLFIATLLALGLHAYSDETATAPTRLGQSTESESSARMEEHAQNYYEQTNTSHDDTYFAEPADSRFEEIVIEPANPAATPTSEFELPVWIDNSNEQLTAANSGVRESAERSTLQELQTDSETSEVTDDGQRKSVMLQIAELKKPTSSIALSTNTEGMEPENLAESFSEFRPMISISATGAGPILPDRYTVGFCHRPLYFEQRNLERCGLGCGIWQNAFSGSRFLCNTVFLPYHAGQKCCCELVPAGGDCKCGQSFPCDCGVKPVTLIGLSKQAAVAAGFTFLLL